MAGCLLPTVAVDVVIVVAFVYKVGNGGAANPMVRDTIHDHVTIQTTRRVVEGVKTFCGIIGIVASFVDATRLLTLAISSRKGGQGVPKQEVQVGVRRERHSPEG